MKVEHVFDLVANFSMLKSTIYMILKNKDVIKAADIAKGVKVLTEQN